MERDATLKQLEHDLKEIKATKRSANDAELQEPKKSKKSPRGLSVSESIFVHLLLTAVALHIGMCTQGSCFLH